MRSMLSKYSDVLIDIFVSCMNFRIPFKLKFRAPRLYKPVQTYIIGHNYHGHYLHAGGLSVNNYVREYKVREVNVRE